MLSVAIEPPREQTVRLLAHELAHVRQAWMLSRDFDDQYKQAGPYNQNIYEKAAYSVADRFMNQNRSRIKAGTFDRLLPSWITQAK
jgi:hypothetical protein